MIEFKHPSQLNPYQIYQQARRIAKRTSRAKNPDWYVSPVEVQRQWHLWIGKEEVVSAVFDRKAGRWIEGPEVPWLINSVDNSEALESERNDVEAVHSALAEVLRSRELGGKVKSLGIIWHVANEFAVVDLSRDFSGLTDFDDVQNSLQQDPQLVLGDASVDPLSHTWRLLPYWGVKEGGRRSVVVQMSKDSENFLSTARDYGEDQNIALVTMAVSAPLEALALIPLYLGGEELDRGSIVIMQYQSFSAMAGLNAEGELTLLRALQHREGADYFTGLGDVLLNTKALLGLDDPVVHILPMKEGSGTEGLTSELTKFFAGREPMDVGFIELDQLVGLKAVFGGKLEMLMSDAAENFKDLAGDSLFENVTFTNLYQGGWALQDFAPLPLGVQEVYPSWKDLQLRKWFGVGKVALVLLSLGIILWGGGAYMSATATEGWKLNQGSIDGLALKTAELNKKKHEIEYWEKIMRTRSEGWSNMALLLKLFPQNKGVVVTSFRYTAESFPLGGKKETEAGVKRQWAFQGFAIPQAVPYLNSLGTTKAVKKLFTDLAEETGAEEFDMSQSTRVLNATMQRKQGTYPASGTLPPEEAGKYQIAFDMNITQSYIAGDDLAIPLKQAK